MGRRTDVVVNQGSDLGELSQRAAVNGAFNGVSADIGLPPSRVSSQFVLVNLDKWVAERLEDEARAKNAGGPRPGP